MKMSCTFRRPWPPHRTRKEQGQGNLSVQDNFQPDLWLLTSAHGHTWWFQKRTAKFQHRCSIHTLLLMSIDCKLSLKISNSCKCPSYFIYRMLRNELNRLSITQYWNLPWWKNSSVTFSLHCLLNSQVRHGLQISAHFKAI